MEENKKDVLPLEGEPLTAPQISEPVVNALAAALSKIETYVPTQYIDDGPPDIDADHLNHAEQAIMRVTNLANGAADAIAALQSQVTQLNNNLTNGLNKKTQFDDLITRKVPIVSENTMFAAGETKEIYINSSYDGYTRIGVAGYNLASYDFIIGSIVDSSIAVKNNSETEKVLNKDSYVSVLYVKNR